LNCPNCHAPFPWHAALRLNFGVRNFRCKNCGAISGMNPYIFFRWSLVPLLLVLIAVTSIYISLWLFLALFIVIRFAWVFASPRIVPLVVQNKPTTTE
jgi:CXXC-20-CXXC protein